MIGGGIGTGQNDWLPVRVGDHPGYGNILFLCRLNPIPFR
jgi:hypothetical protein